MFEQTEALQEILSCLLQAGRLKSLKRAGWVRVGIPDPESVADHTFRLVLMVLLIGPRLGLNADKAMRLALLHDIGETRLGDLMPSDEVTRAEKSEREAAAFREVVADLPEGPALFELWCEYEDGTTREARFVRQVDKLEMALQALEYELAYGHDLSEFWQSARAALTEPLLVELFERLVAQRPH